MTTNRRRNLCHKLPKQRMRPWLINLIDNCSIPGLRWVDEAQKIFRVPWKHGSRQNWKREDANLFILWAQHRGKYHPDRDRIPNTKKFKATFRCALNSLPDCDEIVEKSRKSGHDAFKVYKFSECEKRKTRKIRQKEDSDESMSKDSFIPEERLLPDNSDTNSNEPIPRLEELFGDSLRTCFPSGGIYFLQEEMSEDITLSKDGITAHEILERIENHEDEITTEEMSLDISYLEEPYVPYSEEVIIQTL